MKSQRNLVLWRANEAMLDQETDNTETSKQIDFSVASSSKEVIEVRQNRFSH